MNRKGMTILILGAIVLFLLLSPKNKSGFSGSSGSVGVSGVAQSVGAPTVTNQQVMNAGPVPGAQANAPFALDGVSAAALIPREVVSTDDFGQYDPSAILSGQNYLDPRSQVGYPETLGGVLRNANRQERSEPLNPRDPVSIFNLSTIPPDVMRPRFEVDFDYN